MKLIQALLVASTLISTCMQGQAAPRHRKKFKKDAAPLVVIVDPGLPSFSDAIEKGADPFPTNLKSGGSANNLKSVTQGTLAPLESVKVLINSESYLEALAVLKMHMSLGNNFKLSEQIRLWLLRSKLESRVANWAQAKSALLFAHALIDAERVHSQGDNKRLYVLAQLKSHANLVESDLLKTSGGSRSW